MTRILGISFDGVAAPSISLKQTYFSKLDKETTFGWGYGWYPQGERAGTILKDATEADSSKINEMLTQWQRFHSAIFIGHLRGAAKGISQQSTQPFGRSYAGRDWIMLHNGDLNNYKDVLILDEHTNFEPLGQTDSEHLFCWLMQNIASAGARRIADIDQNKLAPWLATINQLGTANIMLSDGDDLLVYQDVNLFNPLKYCRRHPPYENTILESEDVLIDLSSGFDTSRTMVVFATQVMSDESWTDMEPGQFLVVRRGWIKWDSKQQKDYKPEPLISINAITTHSEPAILRVYHSTTYRYDKAVELSKHLFRLRPVHADQQEVISFDLVITPDADKIEYTDVFNNHAVLAEINQPYTEFSIVTQSVVKIAMKDLYSDPLAAHRQTFPIAWMPWQQQVLMPYLLPPELPTANLEELSEYAKTFVYRNDADLLAVLNDLNNVIYHDYEYESDSTSLMTTPYEVYIKRKGVCQDFANLFICIARLLNIPARYRTGYIYTGANYKNKIQSEASHAWIEAYIPMVGWRGYDPTNGILAGNDHVRVACGRNYRDATPTSGTIYEGGSKKEILEVDVRVTKEAPLDYPRNGS